MERACRCKCKSRIRRAERDFTHAAGNATVSTRNISVLLISLGVQAAWALASVCLLSVNLRILGLLYNAKKEKFGWFSH